MCNWLSKLCLFGVLFILTSTTVVADTYRMQFDPAIVLPKIAVETSRQGYKNEKNTVVRSQRIANRLSLSSDDGMRVGILRYRDEVGKSLYGLGYRNHVFGVELNTIMNNKGLVLAIEKNKVLYNFQVKTEEPEKEKQTTYVQFSFVGNF